MPENDPNTLALTINTTWIIISTIVGIVIFIGGFFINKYRTKNVVKNSINRKGEIFQTGGDNIIDNVDNEEGKIIQN